LVGNRLSRQHRKDEPEEQDCDANDDSSAEDVIDEPVPILHFRDDGPTERGDAVLDETQAAPGGDQIVTPGNASRAIIAMPRAAKHTAKAKRTLEAFAFSSSRVPRFVPENTPMITIAARAGSTKPWE